MRKILGTFLIVIGIFISLYVCFMVYETKKTEEKYLNIAEKISKNVSDTDNNTISYKKYKNGEIIGTFFIPKLDRNLPIIQGTDDTSLGKGVGHMNDTLLPGENGLIFLAGHRDTVFRNFNTIKKNDYFEINIMNKTFRYKVSEIKIVSKYDVNILKSKNKEELLVSTCYPFGYIGDAPKRAIFYAYPTN